MGDLPEWLPLSQVSEASLPSQLDLGDEQRSALPDVADLPEELPLSQDRDGGQSGLLSSVGAHPVPPEGQIVEVASPSSEQFEEVAAACELGHRSLLAPRRGRRPNPLLIEALQEAMAATSLAKADSQGQAGPPAVGAGSSASLGGVKRATPEQIAKTRVGEAERLHLIKRPREGFLPPSPLEGPLAVAADCARADLAIMDEDTVSIAKHLLSETPVHLSSKAALAQKVGVDEMKLSRVLPRIASSLVFMDRHARALVENRIMAGFARKDLLLYLDFAAYDETPLSVSLKGDIAGGNKTTGSEQPFPERALPTGAVCHFGPKSALKVKLSTHQGPQKVVQTVQNGALLVRIGTEHVGLVFRPISPLCLIEAGSAQCLRHCQARVSSMTTACVGFQERLRTVCTDRAAANLAAERSLCSERPSSWQTLHVNCEVHKTSSCHTKTFVLVDDCISGMVHCALSLRNGTAMGRFRAALKQEIESRFAVRYGRPSRDALSYKRQIVRLFVNHGANLATRQVLLALCPNGDWRKPVVEYYQTPGLGQPETEEGMLEHTTAGLVTALCASQPHIYPRHRWTGADLAVDALAVFEACHGLLSSTYRRFAASFECGSKASALLGSRHFSHVDQAGFAPIADKPQTSAMVDHRGGQAPAGSAGGAPDGNPLGNAQADGHAWAEVNATHRRLALNWVHTKPLGSLIVIRTVMEPLRALLAQQFRTAGHEWDTEQKAKLLEQASEGKPAERDYRLTVAAEGTDEALFFERVGLLFAESGELWRTMPTTEFTTSKRCLAFRMVARAACLVHRLLAHPHQQYPVKLFRLLKRPELGAEFAEEPTCRLDSWSNKLRQSHPGFEGPELLAKLRLVASVMWKDISVIESKHASVRRLVTQASTQTHTMMFTDLSAQWVCMQKRKQSEAPKQARRLAGKQARQEWEPMSPLLKPIALASSMNGERVSSHTQDLPVQWVWGVSPPQHCLPGPQEGAGDKEKRRSRLWWPLACVGPHAVGRQARHASAA